MDYNNNEWRPVGRGDPLKNDPTFDYSPPTLDRVRYWADTDKEKEKPEEISAALIDAKLKKANPGKNEILLLGVTGDRLRGSPSLQQHGPNILKNAKGETPLLQPKYTSIRRSYYAHQLPTHLMPPPMQPIMHSTQDHQTQTSNMQQPSQHQVPQAMHIVKPAHTEYRHSMPGHTFMTSSPMNSVSMHSKPYYMSTATQPWMHASSLPPTSTSSHSHRYSPAHSHTLDSHHQESAKYLSYHNRPSLTSTPSIMLGVGMGHHEIYSPNSIRGSSSGHKSATTSSRKPWIHDLLQKEFIKPVKPSYSANSYTSETVKTLHMEPQYFEPIARPQGISTTYAPVTFITPTASSTTSTTQTIYITSSTQKPTTSTSLSPMYSSATGEYTTQAPRTTTTLSPTRLLIPNTSNLVYRPTVAPQKMTTDSLFSHYNQPETPLRGPMYLIIEGHSKVKTYGKDELDPHKPKIVPIIPKREPVIRIADPNEKRGTPETFQVRHLHTKPIETTTFKIPIKTTTANSSISSTTAATKPTPSTAPKLVASAKLKTTTKQPITSAAVSKRQTSNTTTTTTIKPETTKSAPKLSVTASTKKPQAVEKLAKKEMKISMAAEKSSAKIEKMSTKFANPNALDSPEKPKPQTLASEPLTGMQGLLTFLDSSLGSIFKEETYNGNAERQDEDKEFKGATTKLKPIAMISNSSQKPIQARVSTKLEPIKAEDYDDYENDNYFQITTEYLPRETRQVFDYDQLPESRIDRIDFKHNSNFETFIEEIDEEHNFSALNLGDEYDDEMVEQHEVGADTVNNKLKQADSFVSSSLEDDDDDFDDISSLIGDDLTEEDLINLGHNQRPQSAMKRA